MGVTLDLGMSLLNIGRGSTLEGENKAHELAHYYRGPWWSVVGKTKCIGVLDVHDHWSIS